MRCVVVDGGSVVSANAVTDVSQCPATGAFLALEPSDVPPNPLVLTTAQGAAVSLAVGGVWLIAAGWRYISRAVDQE